MNHSRDSDYAGVFLNGFINKAWKANAWIVPQNIPGLLLLKAIHLIIQSFDAYKFIATDNMVK
jgi:hypothetical protein